MKNLIKLKKDSKTYQIYAVTDRYWLNGRNLKDDVIDAILGGATIIQLREKNLSDEEFITEARIIKKVCDKYDIPFIINDNLKVMLAVDADGIHIGQDDLDARLVKEKIGNKKILGVSCQTVEEALIAQEAGADYLGVGTIFDTTTKSDAINVSINVLRKICQKVNIPVVAIGGITYENMSRLNNSLIDGIAVVSAIFAQKNIKEATINLKKKFNGMLLNLNNYNSFIIDYDGTILDSMPFRNSIASQFLISKNIKNQEDIDFILLKKTSEEAVDYIQNKYLKNKTKEEVNNEIKSFIINLYLKQNLINGVLDFLKIIKQNGKVILYSSSEKELLLASIKVNNIGSYFDEVISAKTSNEKENGEGYLSIIKSYNFNIDKTLIIEDQKFATKGARSKGIDTLQVVTNNLVDEDSKYITNYRKGI